MTIRPPPAAAEDQPREEKNVSKHLLLKLRLLQLTSPLRLYREFQEALPYYLPTLSPDRVRCHPYRGLHHPHRRTSQDPCRRQH